MKAALYYLHSEAIASLSQSSFLEQLLSLYRYAETLRLSPCAMYMDCIARKDNEAFPAFCRMLEDADRGAFSIVLLSKESLPFDPAETPVLSNNKSPLCIITMPQL